MTKLLFNKAAILQTASLLEKSSIAGFIWWNIYFKELTFLYFFDVFTFLNNSGLLHLYLQLVLAFYDFHTNFRHECSTESWILLCSLCLQLNDKFTQNPTYVRKGILRNFANLTRKHQCKSLFFNKIAGSLQEICNFIKKETLAQVFSFEISKNTFFTEHLRATASENLTQVLSREHLILLVFITFINDS